MKAGVKTKLFESRNGLGRDQFFTTWRMGGMGGIGGRMELTEVGPADEAPTMQELWDEIAAVGKWVLAPFQTTGGDGGAFSNNDAATGLVSDGDEVQSIAGFGTNLPNIYNLLNKLTSNPADSSNVSLWHSSEGSWPLFKDFGDFDMGVWIHNSHRYQLESQSGSISPAITAPYQEIICFRFYPCAPQETTGYWKDQTSGTTRYTQANPDVDGAVSLRSHYYKNVLLEYHIDGSGNWEIFLNGTSIGSGSGGGLTNITDWWVGAAGHPMEHHFRFALVNIDGDWTPGELATIRTNALTIWPNDYPSYPTLQGIEVLAFNQFDSTNKIWDLFRNKTAPTFRGGTGTAGTHVYQWYYWDTNWTGTPTYIGNKFDYHLPFGQIWVNQVDFTASEPASPVTGQIFINTTTGTSSVTAQSVTANFFYTWNGSSWTQGSAYTGNNILGSAVADGQSSTLDRNDFISGNASGNYVIFPNPGNSAISLMCVVIPYDDEGNPGQPIVTAWITDNTG